MRVAVSGSHGTGKSSLIARFLQRFPEYAHEPEAYETLGDDVDLTDSGVPTPEGLRRLLEYTVASVQGHARGERVIFERSPADYLAYAGASRGAWRRADVREFVATHAAAVRASLQHLDLVAYIPVSAEGAAGRPGEDERFRRRVDVELKRVLLDDEHELFGPGPAPLVVALPARLEHQLAALSRQLGPGPRSAAGVTP